MKDEKGGREVRGDGRTDCFRGLARRLLLETLSTRMEKTGRASLRSTRNLRN